ncbi:putative RNA methyltransferase [Chytriomyces sp. MP71]|nr:putative RNA methyltransferase [Chytriomyces sp. MP71]
MKRAGGSANGGGNIGRRPRKKTGTQAAHNASGGGAGGASVGLKEGHAASLGSSTFNPPPASVPGKPRSYTVSVAISASMIAQLEKAELRTFLAGQIARTLTIMQVDEVVVYEDAPIPPPGSTSSTSTVSKTSTDGPFESASKKTLDATLFLARILQYCECPPYLRKALFPVHRDLQFASMINLESPHHTRIDDPIPFREGVTLDSTKRKDGSTLVDCGLRGGVPVLIKDKAIKAGVRVTAHLEDASRLSRLPANTAYVPAAVVSPSFPRESMGVYWGYTVRLAGSIGKVLSESSYGGGYDATIGISEHAPTYIGESVTKESLGEFKHLMVVFGGAKGLEYSVGADEGLSEGEDECAELFGFVVRPLVSQGARRLRTEEAVLITMTTLRNALE